MGGEHPNLYAAGPVPSGEVPARVLSSMDLAASATTNLCSPKMWLNGISLEALGTQWQTCSPPRLCASWEGKIP
jgi:hypothetical protein